MGIEIGGREETGRGVVRNGHDHLGRQEAGGEIGVQCLEAVKAIMTACRRSRQRAGKERARERIMSWEPWQEKQ
jgi:hypothetical protein